MSYERFEREHIVLIIVVIALIIIFVKGVLTPASGIDAGIPAGVAETNLDGLRVMSSQSPEAVTYGDGTTEYFPNSFIGLFINGSIIENANIIMENDRALGPLRLICDKLGADVTWDSNSRSITVKEGSDTIELDIGVKYAKINEATVPIDAAPKIVNSYAYVPIRFIAESLNCKVDWFDGRAVENDDGSGAPQPHYVLRMQQVMVSRYPSGSKVLESAQAVQKVKDQLIVAYEKKYNGVFKPLDKKPEESGGQDIIRYMITNLHVSSENDRFFIMPMVWDFMIDKYTGTIYVFDNADVQTINKFDPNAPGALDFAG